MNVLVRCGLAMAAAAGLSAPAQANLFFGFDAGDQGVVVIDGGSVVFRATGGDPGGYLEITDVTSGDFQLQLPAGALGNWSPYLGGTLAFSARNINGEAPDWSGFGELTLVGNGQSLTVDVVPQPAPPADGQWHRYSVTLDVAHLGAALPTILGNVTQASLKLESHNGVSEVVGVDSVAITAVPEPTAAALLLAGLAGLGWRVRRARSGR